MPGMSLRSTASNFLGLQNEVEDVLSRCCEWSIDEEIKVNGVAI